MALAVLLGLIAAVCVVSTLLAYVFIRSNEHKRRSSHERQQIRPSVKPSMDIIVRKLREQASSNRTSLSSTKSGRRSTSIPQLEENELNIASRKSSESANVLLSPQRSTSMASGVLQMRRPRSANWRQGSIFDPQQLALIQFTLPPSTKDERYRRRSVAICNNILPSNDTSLSISSSSSSSSPCLLSFSLVYSSSSQLKIQFHSFQSLPAQVQFQQLTIKVRLSPDGKEKSVQIRKFMEKEVIFENEVAVTFANLHFEKVQEKCLQLTIHGKDRAKKTVHLGQIGKIHFNQLKQFQPDARLEFLHEVEKIKPSSIELLVSLDRKDEQFLHMELQRIKGLKVDQKKLDASCYLQILLLDRHRVRMTKTSKCFKLNATNFNLAEQYDFNVFAYNSSNLDRLLFAINLYSNSNHSNEYKRIAHLKISSGSFCSGSGTVHWQQFQARSSFSMWHALNKEQH